MAYNPGKDRNFMAALRRTMEHLWFGKDVSATPQYPLCLSGESLLAGNAAETGTVALIGTNASDQVVLGTLVPGSISNSALDPQLQQYATVTLTAANLLAMFGAPVTILPAPGAGKAIVVDAILLEMTTTATQFASGGAVSFPYHGGSVATHSGTIPASVVTAAAGTSNTLLGSPTAANGTTVPANTGVDITNATGAFTTGTGTAKVKIWYSTVTL